MASRSLSSRHWKLKELAIRLRKQGLSYKEIANKVPVAKSTISLWVRGVPLSAIQKKRLIHKHDFRLFGIRAIQKMFWQKRQKAFQVGASSVKKATKEGRFLAGLSLYWAEGNKKNSPAITNCDPRMIRYMASWFQEFYAIPRESMVLELHLHTGQNEKNVRKYWSRLVGIPPDNFTKSFIKPEGSGYRKNVHYMGTAKLRVRGEGSTYLLFQILGSIAQLINGTLNQEARAEDWIEKLPYA